MATLIYTSTAYSVRATNDGLVPKIVLYIFKPFLSAFHIDAKQIRNILNVRYPGLISIDPGTEEVPLPNGVSVTPHEVVVYCSHEPTQQELDDIKADLERIEQLLG